MAPAPLAHIYLSPHLDDAVLSCGGLIHQQAQRSERVMVVTICAGDPPLHALSPFAQSLHERWATPADAVAARRAEDLAALSRLGAEAVHFAILDCIYRTDPASGQPLYPSREDLFGPLHPSEAGLIPELARQISQWRAHHASAQGRLYVPLGLGQHVDHQLTRQAAEAAGGLYAYYEDYPYAAQAGAPGPETALVPEPVWLTPADVQAKIAALSAYASQISSFWQGLDEMAAEVSQFARVAGGGQPAERLWRPAEAAAGPRP